MGDVSLPAMGLPEQGHSCPAAKPEVPRSVLRGSGVDGARTPAE